MKNILIFIAGILLFANCSAKTETPYLVIFSFDGFRYDYADSVTLPDLNDVAKNGVRAQWMIPVFPTVTFPNHYSIATGLYPEHTGISYNRFYNSNLKKEYDYRNNLNTSDSSFYKGIPLWNFLQEKEIKTATSNWVGSNANINGMHAGYRVFNLDIPFKNLMDTVLYWLQLPSEKRPHFIMSYFPEPDHTAHSFGPFGKPTLSKIKQIDSLLGYFRLHLQNLDIGKMVNIIVLSDHGMAVADSAKNIFIEKKVADKFIYRIEGGNQCSYVYVKKGLQNEFVAYLNQFKHIKSYSRGNFPKNWHLNDTVCVPDLVLLADEGYNIHIQGQSPTIGGSHGYDNTVQSMQTIFYATGPAFKNNYVQYPFENVDVFPLICNIFKVEVPVNIDGKYKDVEGMLTNTNIH
jgi:alkaline phosphatase D